MRHTDLRMTTAYGDVGDNRVGQALEKVADLAFDTNSTRVELTRLRLVGATGFESA